jgi:hypothetical protein
MSERYSAMLHYTSSVTRNECVDAINRVLDTISTTGQDPHKAGDLHILSKVRHICYIMPSYIGGTDLLFSVCL